MIRELTITRVLDAPRDLVFQAWLDPKRIAQWWGPKGFTNVVREWDARPGGAIDLDMIAPDGGGHPMGGAFREVTPPSRLVFTSTAFEDANGEPGLENLNTVTFSEEGNKTVMTLHVVVLRANERAAEGLAGMEQGWNQTLDRLGDLVTA